MQNEKKKYPLHGACIEVYWVAPANVRNNSWKCKIVDISLFHFDSFGRVKVAVHVHTTVLKVWGHMTLPTHHHTVGTIWGKKYLM